MQFPHTPMRKPGLMLVVGFVFPLMLSAWRQR